LAPRMRCRPIDVTTASRTAAVLPIVAALLLAAAGGGARKRPPTVATASEKGRAIYMQLCATCHGAAGNGYVADNAPSLRSATFLASATDAFLEAAILRGRPGTARGASARATGGPLDPAEANDVIAFLREGGPPAEPLPPVGAGDATRRAAA